MSESPSTDFAQYRFLKDREGNVVTLPSQFMDERILLAIDCERWGLARLHIFEDGARREEVLQAFQKEMKEISQLRGETVGRLLSWGRDSEELFYADAKVPATNLLGHDEGRGFIQLVQQLPQERLLSALRSTAVIEAALDWTVQYTSERNAFGRSVIGFQNTRFTLAEVKAKAVMMRTFIDRCIALHIDGGGLTADDAAIAKLMSTETMCEVLDDCLQLHGGMGYMWETPIARAWADNRMARIAGGTSEIMKEIIGRTLGAEG